MIMTEFYFVFPMFKNLIAFHRSGKMMFPQQIILIIALSLENHSSTSVGVILDCLDCTSETCCLCGLILS